MVKDNSDSESENLRPPLNGLLFLIRFVLSCLWGDA